MPAKAGIHDFSPGDAPLISPPIPPPSLRAKRSNLQVLNSTDDKVKAKQFFFEKKNQKTFAPLRAVLKQPGSKTNKVFLLLFVHKKKFFLPYLPSPA